MKESGDSVLGKQVGYPEHYDPQQLYAIERQRGRESLGVAASLPFEGEDIWNAYEISWLNHRGKPLVACGCFRVRATSPCMVESKSLKLYLNSLNQTRFDSTEAVRETIERDLSACVGEPVLVSLYEPEQWAEHLSTNEARGICIDALDIECAEYLPAPQYLRSDSQQVVDEQLCSHLLRSRCPVTGQPDWASLIISYRGPALDREGLLKYIISYRNNDEFHEQCVERIFCDLAKHCAPEQLTVSARYLRRGGLDINPVRSSAASPFPNLRLFRQ